MGNMMLNSKSNPTEKAALDAMDGKRPVSDRVDRKVVARGQGGLKTFRKDKGKQKAFRDKPPKSISRGVMKQAEKVARQKKTSVDDVLASYGLSRSK